MENFAVDEWVTLLVGEKLLFEMLGRVLYTNPSSAWIDPLLRDELFDSVPFAENQDDVIQGLALLSKWTASVGDHLSDAVLLDLRADFAQLFIGNTPMHAPPWESVYFSEARLTFQQETVDVRGWFERLGLQINTDSREPEDHIAFELSFVARCAELSLEAQNNQNRDASAELLTLQRTFLEKHLLRWGCKWAALVQAHARTDFYRGLALLVSGGLKELSQVFTIEIPKNIHYPGLSGLV